MQGWACAGTATFLVLPSRTARARLVSSDFLGSAWFFDMATLRIAPEVGDAEHNLGQFLDDLPPESRGNGFAEHIGIALVERHNRVHETIGRAVLKKRYPSLPP